MKRRRLTIGIAVATGVAAIAVAGVVALSAPPTAHPSESAPPPSSAAAPPGSTPSPTPVRPAVDVAALAEDYLRDWVDDGRVVRRDQGGDTVSEGQAYGLFAALLADDEDAFDEIWRWTVAELERPDGLLSWHWADGAVVDRGVASDADLDAARALVLAGAQFDRPDLTREGVELATAILDLLTVPTEAGLILLPGTWAQSAPHSYNPSYASPAAYTVLAAATGDPRWDALGRGSAAVTDRLLDVAPLPPDWAIVDATGDAIASDGPVGAGPPTQYAYDAARLPVRYAESCDAEDRALAARLLPALMLPASRADGLNARLTLDGDSLAADERTPLSFAARAAAGAVSTTPGAPPRARIEAALADLDRAQDTSERFPTYYGDSWTLLGWAMLTTDDLGGCPPLAR